MIIDFKKREKAFLPLSNYDLGKREIFPQGFGRLSWLYSLVYAAAFINNKGNYTVARQGGGGRLCSTRKCRICPLQPSFEMFLALKLCTYQRLLGTQK